ncbi:hypothetical protein EBS43_12055 [bacterium]|nr:hypothetical protein [bacterium]
MSSVPPRALVKKNEGSIGKVHLLMKKTFYHKIQYIKRNFLFSSNLRKPKRLRTFAHMICSKEAQYEA